MRSHRRQMDGAQPERRVPARRTPEHPRSDDRVVQRPRRIPIHEHSIPDANVIPIPTQCNLSPEDEAAARGLHLLIKFPTRGRPAEFLRVLDLYRGMLADPDLPHKFLIACDDDDDAMTDPAVREALAEMPDVDLRFGPHTTKVEACNSFVAGEVWDVVLLASDDMVPVEDGYDMIIRRRMLRHFRDLDGVLWFNDGHREMTIDTLCILGRKYYDRFGYIYYPDYRSLWCDNEFSDVARLLGKYTYLGATIIEHRHHAFGQRKFDASDERGNIDWPHDEMVYWSRAARRFDVETVA